MRDMWLVEIRRKNWIPDLSDESKIVGYEEVTADNKFSAKHIGLKNFQIRVNYTPSLRKLLENNKITLEDCYAFDAVQI